MKPPTLTMVLKSVAAAAVGLTLSACSAPTVNLATSEPIKVDINMRLDVYQHGQKAAAKPGAAAQSANPSSKPSRDNRMADIQMFKNNQYVGEGRDGLLKVRWEAVSKEDEDLRKAVRDTVDAENNDRLEMMKTQADREKISLLKVQEKQGEIWRNRAFKGEWIEVQKPDGGEWVWVQKGD